MPPARSLALLAVVAAAGASSFAGVTFAQLPTLRVPTDMGEDALEERARAQLATLGEVTPFAFFRFQDRLAESGIDFRHHSVDDAGKTYHAVHYDHGNGIAAADVDGDGRTDLYFTNQIGANGLWRNLGGGRFANITSDAGVGLKDRISVAASFADVDNDGDPDLYVTTVRGGNVLFENDGHGRFRDATAASGLGYVGHSSGAVFLDFDRDGLLDLFLCNIGVYTIDRQGPGGYYLSAEEAFSGHLYPERAERSLLYRNQGGGRFADVTSSVGLADTGWNGDATFTDLDWDGFPELYVLDMQGDDRLYANLAGASFVDHSAEHFAKTPWGSMGVKFFDLENDGDLDLLVTDMHSDMSENVGPEREKMKARMQWPDEHLQGGADNLFGNALYRRESDGSWSEVSDQLGAENYWPWGPSVADLNADGYGDVFVASSMNYPFRYGINSLLLNDGGRRFVDAEFLLGVEPRAEARRVVPWFELDCSGADRGHLHCEDRQGRVRILAAAGSRSAVAFDLEGDGDLDLVTNEFNDAPQVLVSDLSDQTAVAFLEVELVGTRSNRDGLGARVRLHSGGVTLTQQHDGKSGYLSQSSLPLWFGLGDRREVERIEVLWPSGATQTVSGPIAANTRVEIVEPGSSPDP